MGKELNFQEKLAEKVRIAQEEKKKLQEEALLELLDNEKFIEAQRSTMAKEKELEHLNNIIFQLNSLAPFVAKDGRKFKINVFPINVFGMGHAQVLGIIAGSRGAFTDEKILEYSAITGINPVELIEARDALGSPAYYKDGEVFPAQEGNFEKLSALLDSIYLKLGLNEFKAKDVTRDKYRLWFTLAENKAIKQYQENKELEKLEEKGGDFVLED